MSPKISIITVCYNSSVTIRDTIESVLSQDYPNIEYIIVDGASTDNTVNIVKEYSSRISKLVSEPDNGLYDAMNKGVAMATGEYIGILNSDDFYVNEKVISDLIHKISSEKKDAIFADLVFIAPDDKNKIIRYYKSGPWKPWMFRFGKMPAHPTFFIHKKYYDNFGKYKQNYSIAADFEILVRFLYVHNATFSYLKQPIIKMRAGGLSTSGLKSTIQLNKEIVRACIENGIWTNSFFLLLKIPFKLLELIKPRLFQ